MTTELFPLGRKVPTDFRHLARFPLRAVMPLTVASVDRVLSLPVPARYRPHYNQMVPSPRSSCVGHSLSWAMSIINRRAYSPNWLYDSALKIDEWPGEADDGTSLRAGCEILRTEGHSRWTWKHNVGWQPTPGDGIIAYRWAMTVDEIRTAIAAGSPVTLGVAWTTEFDRPEVIDGERWIGRGNLGITRGGHAITAYGASDARQAVKLVQSWGAAYDDVWLGYGTLERLLGMGGECVVMVDR